MADHRVPTEDGRRVDHPQMRPIVEVTRSGPISRRRGLAEEFKRSGSRNAPSDDV
jgi:hypothetical protein